MTGLHTRVGCVLLLIMQWSWTAACDGIIRRAQYSLQMDIEKSDTSVQLVNIDGLFRRVMCRCDS